MKEKLFTLMEQAYQEIQDLVADLSAAELAATGTPEQWTAKDHLGHMAEWAQRFYDLLSGIPQPSLPDGSPELEAENARIYEKYRAQSWEQVLAAVKQVYEDMHRYVDNLSEQDLVAVDPAQPGSRALWRRVAGNMYLHPVLHLGYIYLWRGDQEGFLRLNEQSAQRLLELDASPAWQGTTLYNLACTYALAGQKTKAISFLSQALHFEPGLIEWSRQDSDLLSLHDEAEYQAIYEQQS